jgi:predicted metalloprotease
MRWREGRRSANIEDRRGRGVGGRRGAVGGAAIVVAILTAIIAKDPSALLALLGGGGGATGGGGSYQPTAAEEQLADFVSVVLADTEDTWGPIFQQMGRTYEEPTLVLFSGSVSSACGMASSAVGPFYCPGDHQVYIDLSFFDELDRRFGAPGDFAQAYVVAHEVGHHIQTLLGTSERVHAQRRQLSEVEGNRLSVRQELQADCYAGVWAHHADRARQVLESGDIEEGLRAATAIGDDTLQRQAQGHVAPDSFTHGTSEQRVRWFRTGLERGTLEACDTFAARAI